MKLKTKCSPHTINGSMDDFSHDAAVAHALVLAMEAIDSGQLARLAINSAREKANELLSEWGYGDVGG